MRSNIFGRSAGETSRQIPPPLQQGREIQRRGHGRGRLCKKTRIGGQSLAGGPCHDRSFFEEKPVPVVHVRHAFLADPFGHDVLRDTEGLGYLSEVDVHV